ncbi:hypothetical protein PGB90_005562 [Kerria lacca]
MTATRVVSVLLKDGDELKKYPVVVFIHGESYEWNSGNPYDGTVLASFANLVVVTINYRLGILGKSGLDASRIGRM